MNNIILFIIIFYVLTVAALIFYYESKIKKMKSNILNPRSSLILKDILKLSIKGENINNATKKIELTIRKCFNFDYCTVYIMRDNKLRIAASNINLEQQQFIEDYINNLLLQLEYEAQIRTSKSVLSYPTAYERKVQYSYFIPLKIHNNIIGAIHIEDKSNKDMDKTAKEFFTIILENITVAFQNILYLEKLKMDGFKDGLTGAYNKRYYNMYMDKLANSTEKDNITIAMLDIDLFKRVNDTYGHEYGDYVLKKVYEIIRINLENSLVIRYGGEEFLIIFENLECGYVKEELEHLRSIFESTTFDDGKTKSNITVSIGIAQTGDIKDICNITACADKALYYSKEHGRNIVTLYKEI